GSRGHEPLRLHKERTAAGRGTPDDAGMVRAHPTSEADSRPIERRENSARIARFPMIVLDASVVVELLTNGALAESLRCDLAGRDDSFIAPHLLDIEVVSAIRKLVAGRRIDSYRSEQILMGLAALPAERYAHT